MPKNQNRKSGPSQEERRRQAANRPIGGGTPKKTNNYNSYRRRPARWERISAIVAVIMLVAILLSLVPACLTQVGTASAMVEAQASSSNSQLITGSRIGLQRVTAEQPLTASLPRSTQALPDDKIYVGETGHYISGDFLTYWKQQDGANLFGNPLSEEFTQNNHTVQLFEKALLELHPEETDPKNRVQLGFLGRQLATALDLTFEPAVNNGNSSTRTYFAATKQVISGKFKSYWDKNNGLSLLGYPISGEISSNDQTIQYFERGFLQIQGNTGQVETGNAGDALLKAKGWPRPTRLNIDLDIDGNEIYQGRTLAVRLASDSGWEPKDLKGNVGEEALKLTKTGSAFWAFKAFAPWADVKTYPLQISYTDPAGRSRELNMPINVIKYNFPDQNLSLPGDKQNLIDPVNEDYDNKQLAVAYNSFTPTRLWNGFWSWPVLGEITTQFAEFRSFADAPDASSYYHGGIDIAQNQGTPVAAPADGRVVFTGPLRVRGNAIALDHGLGVTSYYFHLSSILVAPGDEIKKGQIIGKVGTTGRSNGPHLHWEVRVNGIITYPQLFINKDLSY
ncbi:MAG TPA: M23 family metallopeptidase [Chloroflexia bacterium]|nr:M23 family metallopeptidase [Chloroflexia bacterium]